MGTHIPLSIRSFHAFCSKNSEKIKYIYLELVTFEMLSGVNGFLMCDTGVCFTLRKFRGKGVGGISGKPSNAFGFDVCTCNKNKSYVQKVCFTLLTCSATGLAWVLSLKKSLIATVHLHK
jgi:hypothetical protein